MRSKDGGVPELQRPAVRYAAGGSRAPDGIQIGVTHDEDAEEEADAEEELPWKSSVVSGVQALLSTL